MFPFKGLIFDMNGTLLRDNALHEEAWIKIAENLRDKPLTVAEFQEKGHGRTNHSIISYLMGREPSQKEFEQIVEEKESTYREMCFEHPSEFKLAAGVEDFLNEVDRAGIPRTIATGSYPTNVDFYFKHLNLHQWFNRELVVLDDDTYEGKPKPFIYRIAAQKLNLAPQDCYVFEDSYSGIKSAFDAPAKKIIAIEPSLDQSKLSYANGQVVFTHGFNDFSLNDFKMNNGN